MKGLRGRAITLALLVASALLAMSGPANADPAVDQLMPRLLAEHGIPGAAVAIVSAGRPAEIKGYGYADTERKIPVDASRTAFSTASLAKTFTAAAALQLVQEGRLSLDKDVNTYLTGFRIPDTFPGHPITLRHLLTHTAGFESDVIGTSWSSPAAAEPLKTVVREGLPERARPPGTVLSYDNYAYDLAGYLVETVSGRPYGDYVREHILDPLNMTGTSFAAPLPAGTQVAKGYGGAGAFAHYYGHPASGTGPVTTAADMARFMKALLDDDPRLGRGVAVLMKTRQYAQDPRLPGMGYGLEESTRNGHRVLYKGGDVTGFHQLMTLLPDQRTGVYVVFNGEDSLPASAYDLIDAVIDRSFPGSPPQPRPTGGDTSAYEGTYVSAQPRGDLLRFAALFDHVTVQATGDGRLTTTGLSRDGSTQRWRQVGPGLFAEDGGQELIAFDSGGLLAGGHREEATTFERSPVTPHVWMLYLGLTAFLAALLGVPIAALLRRPARHRAAWWLAWLTSALVAVFVYGLATTIIIAPTDAILLGSPLLTGALLASSAAFTLTAGLLVCTGSAWWKGWWSLPGRLAYTTFTAATVCFMIVAYLYNLVGGVFA